VLWTFLVLLCDGAITEVGSVSKGFIMHDDRFESFLSAIRVFAERVKVNPENAENLRQELWVFGDSDASVSTAVLYASLACFLVEIENDVQLSVEHKLLVIEQIVHGFRPVFEMIEDSARRLHEPAARERAARDTREMRREIAASIGGMGNHLNRRKST
jgi:hypothetical protein